MEAPPPKDRYRWLGFRETNDDGSLPSLHDARGKIDPREVEGVVAYLRSGVPVMEIEEEGGDVFNLDVELPHTVFLSYGEWIWRNDLDYYVKTYGTTLNSDFVAKALRLGSVDSSHVNVDELEDWLLEYD